MKKQLFDISAIMRDAFPEEKSGAVALGTFASVFSEFNDPSEIERKKRRDQKDASASRGDKYVGQSELERKEKRREARDNFRARKRADQLKYIAVLDMETDPFDAVSRDRIAPFAACIYSDLFEPIVIWEENEEKFIAKLIAEIIALPNSFTIYAHNGGKFDFMFLLHRLRGRVSFKGRGIMAAKLGAHELRDSFHIIPERLAAYQKQEFDYQKMKKTARGFHRKEIIDYLISDCVYLFDIVKTFLTQYGMKISIGQAAMFLLKRQYPKCQNVTAHNDEYLRQFFFGGRVECLQGRGEFVGERKLYDVNSMYPFVMAMRRHPIGNEYRPRVGKPNANTCFIDLNCFSFGAFPVKRENEGTTFPHEYGRYKVSIYEYEVALKYGRIKNASINYCVDNELMTTFSDFILPLYSNRQKTKNELKRLEANGLKESAEYINTKKDDIFYKLLMNNAYGKFAQNPRRFKENYLTDFDKRPDEESETWGIYPEMVNADYAIWSRPLQKLRFNNVGTAASITGASRAVLFEAIINSIDAVYCDTDSLICRELRNTKLDAVELGAWDCESEMTRILIAGKKLYAYEKPDGKQIIKSKGVSGFTWENMKDAVNGQEILMPAFAPTLTKRGTQSYIDRRISATVKVK